MEMRISVLECELAGCLARTDLDVTLATGTESSAAGMVEASGGGSCGSGVAVGTLTGGTRRGGTLLGGTVAVGTVTVGKFPGGTGLGGTGLGKTGPGGAWLVSAIEASGALGRGT